MDVFPISVLGSTGSIGTQTLDVCEKLHIPVSSMAFGKNVTLAEQQARRFHPNFVASSDEEAAKDLKIRLADTDISVLSGTYGVIEAAMDENASTVVTAVVGTAGLLPTMAAISRGKRIALANKETLVCAGRLVMAAARDCGAEIVPVDSEHSAIFQSMDNKNGVRPVKILLTASGGPFFGKTYDEIKNMPPEKALKHPNWSMGAKVTIDSASMMNKGLEFIEAMHLFSMEPDAIEVLVHRQSIMHSAVEFSDGSVIAQMGVPDMRVPIQYALTYPDRAPAPCRTLSLSEIGTLTFDKPNLDTFKCLGLAMECARRGGTYGAVMNAANEIAVGLYLNKKISFGGIYESVHLCVETIKGKDDPELSDILEIDAEAREFVKNNYIV